MKGLGEFAFPYILLFIPVVFFLLLLGSRRFYQISSRSIFEIMPLGAFTKAVMRFLWLLPLVLLLIGFAAGVIALAGPVGSVSVPIEKTIEAKVAILIDDGSGSMAGENLQKLVAANKVFLREFCGKKEGDSSVSYVGLVLFESDAYVKMVPTKECSIVERRLDAISVTGGTLVEKGLWLGFLQMLDFADNGALVPARELKKIELSLGERYPYFPEKRKEFCQKHQGLSFMLFTDGGFYTKSRQQALESSSFQHGVSKGINPFHVIEIMHSLCMRTYFWSVEQVLPDYQAAFSSPKGMGEVYIVSNTSEKALAELYRKVAVKERGRMSIKEEIRYNPFEEYFIGMAVWCSLAGIFLLYICWFSRNITGKEAGK